MHVHDFRLAGASICAATAKTLSPVLAQWALDWFLAPPSIDVSISAEQAASFGDDWIVFEHSPECWMAWRGANGKDLLRLIFGPEAGTWSSRLGEQVLQDCIADLANRCLMAGGIAAPAPSRKPLAGMRIGAGSGMVNLCLKHMPEQRFALGGGLVELLSPNALPAPAPSGQLTPRRALLGKARVSVEVRLGEAELALSDLVGIGVGDVLMLDVSPAAPLPVRTLQGDLLFNAHLGRQSSRKAVQIISE